MSSRSTYQASVSGTLFTGHVFCRSPLISASDWLELEDMIVRHGGKVTDIASDPSTLVLSGFVTVDSVKSRLQNPNRGLWIDASVIRKCSQQEKRLHVRKFCLRNCAAHLCGVSDSMRPLWTNLIQFCGGRITSEVNENVNVVVGTDSDELVVAEMRNLGAQLFDEHWLLDLVATKRWLKAAVIGFSGFYPHNLSEQALLENMVILLGGITPGKLDRSTDVKSLSCLVVTTNCSTCSTSKYANAKRYGIPIVTPNWVQDSLANGCWLSEDSYLAPERLETLNVDFSASSSSTSVNSTVDLDCTMGVIPNTPFAKSKSIGRSEETSDFESLDWSYHQELPQSPEPKETPSKPTSDGMTRVEVDSKKLNVRRDDRLIHFIMSLLLGVMVLLFALIIFQQPRDYSHTYYS